MLPEGKPGARTNPEWVPFLLRQLELSIERKSSYMGEEIGSSSVPRNQSSHKIHRGVSRMKQVTHSHVWWLNLDKNLESLAVSTDV